VKAKLGGGGTRRVNEGFYWEVKAKTLNAQKKGEFSRWGARGFAGVAFQGRGIKPEKTKMSQSKKKVEGKKRVCRIERNKPTEGGGEPGGKRRTKKKEIRH